MINSQTCPHRSLLSQSIVYQASNDVIYMNNAKAGCSTIKSTILKEGLRAEKSDTEVAINPKSIHGDSSFWCNDYSRISSEKTFVFSVVRNPFTRVLSAFLDKFRDGNILGKQFFWQNGFDQNQDISFLQFLQALDSNRSLFDQHWRPQSANLYVGLMPLHEVHFLESLDKTQGSICERLNGVSSFVKRNPHSINAQSKVTEYIDEESKELILKLYKDDFEVFGYSKSLSEVSDAPQQAIEIPKQSPVLTEMLSKMTEDRSPMKTVRLTLHALGLVNLSDEAAFANTDVWAQQVIELSQSENPSTRYLALSALTGPALPGVTPDLKLRSLKDIVQMAPYQIGNHVALARQLAQVGKAHEAQAVLDNLMGMTWQTDMVSNVKQQLAGNTP